MAVVCSLLNMFSDLGLPFMLQPDNGVEFLNAADSTKGSMLNLDNYFIENVVSHHKGKSLSIANIIIFQND